MDESGLEGAKFLTQKYPDLHNDIQIQNASEQLGRKEGFHPDSLKKEEKVNAYMQRLQKLFAEPDERRRIRNINMVIDTLIDSVVISDEDFPDRYLENEQRLAREQGHGEIRITPELRAEALRFVQDDQKASFMRWIDYLSSGDAPYPAWFKYYALRSVANLQPFDKGKNQFPKRSRSTTKIFPEVNREALAFVYEALTDDTPQNDEALEKLVSGGNFGKLYGHAVERQLNETAEAKEKRTTIEGSWVKYEKYDEYDNGRSEDELATLVESLQGMGTGWCTAGEEMARIQLEGGDFYVFYSRDDVGKDSVPRVAIRMVNGQVAEVRGVAANQELESELIDVARKKFMNLPGGDKYEKKVQDMRQLTALEKKINEGEEDLTEEELRFLYEIDSPIEGFGYREDPRIKELQSKRNTREDAMKIFTKTAELERKIAEDKELTRDELIYLYRAELILNPDESKQYTKTKKNRLIEETKNRLRKLSEERRNHRRQDIANILDIDADEVAVRPEEATDQTRVYAGRLFPGISRLQNIEHVYLTFPDSEIIFDEVTLEADSSKQLVEAIDNNNRVIITGLYRNEGKRFIKEMIESINFEPTDRKGDINHVLFMTSEQLRLNGIDSSHLSSSEFYEELHMLGMELCPPEIALQYALQKPDKIPQRSKVVLGEDPINISANNNLAPDRDHLFLTFDNSNENYVIVDVFGVAEKRDEGNYLIRLIE